MKIQKGKFYRTRSGEKVECLTTDCNEPCKCAMLLVKEGTIFWTREDGLLYNASKSKYDIISEWSEVEIPWDDYPKWCMSVKMICNETWGMFDYRNQLIDSIPSEYAPKGFEGDWKESKFERPKND